MPRWSFLTKSGNIWDKEVMAKVIKRCIILHNMLVEARRNGYVSKLWELAEDGVVMGYF